MSLHRLTRSQRVMPRHGLEDSLVVNLSAFRTAIDVEDSHALFTQHSYDRIDQGENERVRRRFGQGKMKIEVRFDEGVSITPRVVHHTDRLSHCCKILLFSANRCQRSDLGLKNFANL